MKPISLYKITALGQILVFAGLLIVQCLPLFWSVTMPHVFWVKQALMYVIWLGMFYFNLKVLLPHLLFARRSGLFFVSILVIVFVILLLSNEIDVLINIKEAFNKQFHESAKDIKPERDVIGHFWTITVTLLLIGCSTVLGVGKKLREEAFARETLEKEKINSELSFLKTQINPHFFFNTLNSIYALADGKPEAREAIYNLSRLMRYVLYDTRHNLTSLLKEVAFAEDYIKLMELRMTPNVQVIFDKPASLKEIEVAPMLFLPFVENAFKHGISSLHPSFIYIGIKQDDEQLEIEVRNSLFPNQPTEKEESNGIGLINTRRRLNLIYPGKYTLETREDTDEAEFYVKLTLDLS